MAPGRVARRRKRSFGSRRSQTGVWERGNDGREVAAGWLADAVLEIVDHFGAATYETQKVEGHWRHGGVLYRDDLVRVVVDMPDSANNRQWMRQFKERWKARLEQIDLWMVSYRIEIE